MTIRGMLRATAFAAFATTVAACGGGGTGGGFGAPAPLSTNSPGTSPNASITIKIVVPQSTATKYHLRAVAPASALPGGKRPAYVSTSTLSIQIVVNGNTAGATVANVSCASFPCSATATLSAPTNQTDTFAIEAFDGANATGNALSDGSVTQFVPLGLTTIPVSLGGVVANIGSVNICPPATPGCGQSYQSSSSGASSWTVSINNAYDADNNVIVGTYDVPIKLFVSEADISRSAVTVSPTSLASSSSTSELIYNGQFDGEDQVSATISGLFCDSLGTPTPNCSSSFAFGSNSANGYAIFQSACPSGAPVCSSFSMYGSYNLGQFGTGLGEINNTVYVDDTSYLLDSLGATGITLETPVNGFLLEGLGTLAPPATLSYGSSPSDFQTIGGTLYFDEAGEFASFTPGGSPGTGSYAETSVSIANGGGGAGSAIGSDGKFYIGENYGSNPEIAQYDIATQVLNEFTLASTDNEQWLTALGTKIWFAASAASYNGKFFVGYMPVTQNPAINVPRANEFFIGALSGTDYWQIDQLVAVPASTSNPNGLLFFDGTDLNDTVGYIGTMDPSTHAVSIYQLPSTWPVNANPGAMAYNPVDQYVYFSDYFNGIIGRIPSVTPSQAGIQGYGTPFNEAAGAEEMMIDPNPSSNLLRDIFYVYRCAVHGLNGQIVQIVEPHRTAVHSNLIFRLRDLGGAGG